MTYDYTTLLKKAAEVQQESLLSESEFIRFAAERGLSVSGVVPGDPSDFVEKGWLTADGKDHSGCPAFHPFRLHALYKILEEGKLRVATSIVFRTPEALRVLQRALGDVPSDEEMQKRAVEWNAIANLAILLEPIYWPLVTGSVLRTGGRRHDTIVEEYRQALFVYVRTLEPSVWRDRHELLRMDAHQLDGNSELYVLLRVGIGMAERN